MSNQQKDSQDEQLVLLREIKSKVDQLDENIAQFQKESRRAGAVAGGVAGGITGGIVATGLALARAKLGLF